MQLSIIIVNYNVKYFLEHCLLSAIKACENIEAEILVVDNNSTDGSKAYLETKFKTVTYFWNNENIGFGKANNFALPFAKGEYILFLNPDTIVPEDCFTNCISFFESHSDCGAVGVRMIDGAGNFLKESKRSLPTPSAGFFKMVGLAEIFPSSKMFAQYYAGNVPEKENNAVDVLAGAFMMLSKKAIELTEGFDENFFMYGEDIDLSYRIQKAGLQNYYLGETTIIHFKGESTQKKSSNYIDHFYGAIKRFVDKHYSHQQIKQGLMNIVIVLGKHFAKAKQLFTKIKINKKTIAKLNCIYVGNESQTESINEIISNSGNKIIANTNAIENLFTVLEKNNASAVIFSEDNISKKTIIKNIERLPKKYLALFYAAGAKSIIGSNNKNERGIFIAKP
jgi:N-acetylglucosaminyl-diphospho-decaprenol L-rhamnosyltransferase